MADRFAALDVRHAPGQSAASTRDDLVDFSHGDVDAFPPSPRAADAVAEAIASGAAMAYSEYRGHHSVRVPVSERLAAFTGAPVDPDTQIIVTPGTQTALYLALSSLVEAGDRVVIVDPDYFANRKITMALGGIPVPVRLFVERPDGPAVLDLEHLAAALAEGARAVVLSNPNNPSGAVYDEATLAVIVELVRAVGATLVVDQLYSRLVYDGRPFVHARGLVDAADSVLTLMGPSKTESLSGFRVGVAVGPAWLVDRMEQLLSIVSLRAAGYNQAALLPWFDEPHGWLDDRVRAHADIRDGLLVRLRTVPGLRVRTTEAGSYLFPLLPDLDIPVDDLVLRARTEEGVVVTRGAEFGSALPSGVRFNFSQDAARALAAVGRFVALVERHRV